jgi:hypothetical protein
MMTCLDLMNDTPDTLDAAKAERFPPAGRFLHPTAFAAALPALRPENRQPPKNVPSSER